MGDEEGRSETESSKERKESFEVSETSKKIIRVITVTTYLFSVSMAAIMLSLYYLFFWNPTVQSGAQRLVDPIQLHFSRLYFNVTPQKALSPDLTPSAIDLTAMAGERGAAASVGHVTRKKLQSDSSAAGG